MLSSCAAFFAAKDLCILLAQARLHRSFASLRMTSDLFLESTRR